MKKSVTLGETLFAKIFNIIAGKDYLVAWQWNSRRPSRFFPLNSSIKNLVLASVLGIGLGLACLAMEAGIWLQRECSLHYQVKQNAALKQSLAEVLSEQSSFEATLTGMSQVEEKIRALYGMKAQDKALVAFGVGGRRPETVGNPPFASMVSEQILHSSLKNRQLQSKIDFTNASFVQIQDYVKARRKLWDHTPFVLPTKGEVTSGFGYRLHPVTGRQALHEGLDIANSKWTPIFATADGIVTASQQNGSFGNLVVVNHGNGYSTKYGHLTKIRAWRGQPVKRYGLIGYMGSTGRTTGTHLHYEVHHDGFPQNPEKFILPSGILVD